MATRETTALGAITDPAKWDGGVSLPVAGDIVQIKHAMTIGTGKTFPDAGVLPFASIDFKAAAAGSLTVTGTVTIRGTIITNFQTVNDAAATNLIVVGEVYATATWTNGAAVATPTVITGNMYVGTVGTPVGGNGITQTASCGLSVSGNLTAYAATYGLRGNASCTLNVGGNYYGNGYTGLSHSGSWVHVGGSCTCIGTYDGIALSGGPDTFASLAGTSTTNGHGINLTASAGVAGPGGSPATCNAVGIATSTFRGISFVPSTNQSYLGNLTGATTGTGSGVVIGGSGTATATGNVTGTCGGGGIGITIHYLGFLIGDIIITSDPTSSWIYVYNNMWRGAAGAGTPGRIRAAAGNTIQVLNAAGAAAQEFCPTANVVPAANVRSGVATYTGGPTGTAELSGMGPYPVSSKGIGPYAVEPVAVGPLPVF
jgi:hypothetical protein